MDTRWSSSLFAIERLLLLKQHILFIFQTLNPQKYPSVAELKEDSTWKNLAQLVSILKPFQIATDTIQAESATIFTVYVQFKNLLTQLPELISTIPWIPVDTIHNSIMIYWEKYININATIMSAIFSFNDYKNYFKDAEISKAKRWFIDFGCDYLLKYNCSNLCDREAVRNLLSKQYGMFLCRAPPFNTLPVQLQSADQKSVQNEWFFFVDDAPELTKSVLAILSLPASEASVERSFSQQALVHRKHRNRMRAEQVETEMIIKYNLRPKINKIIKETAT
jgi:hypothetical protein